MEYKYSVFSLLNWDEVTCSFLEELRYRYLLLVHCLYCFLRCFSRQNFIFGIQNLKMSEKKLFVPKTPMDFQKLKLERLMANPDKPVIIPDTPREKKGFTVPEFVRNVMGSSAGAGSGEFHVYRHLRRKEYTRQKMIDEKAEMEKLDEEYDRKIEENKKKMEEKTAKKRAKRLKQKARLKKLKTLKGSQKNKKVDGAKKEDSSEDDSSSQESSGDEKDSDEEKHNSSTESSRDLQEKDNPESLPS